LRHTEKGLITVEYLLKYADQRFARSCKVHARHFQKLKGYTYDLYGRDFGGNVRRRATRIATMLENDEELEKARLEAQGRTVPEKKKKSVTSVDITSTKKDENSKNSEEPKNIKPSAAKKKKKTKEDSDQREKDPKKPKEQMAPTEDLLGDVFISAPKTTQTNASSDDWLEEFNVEEDGGAAEDGGKFGFADFEDENALFDNNENKNEKQTEDSVDKTDEWMTKLTHMDDPLQELEKPQQKVNKKGKKKTMNQLQSKQKDFTGTFDDSFLQTINAGLTGQTTSTQPTTQSNLSEDPFFRFDSTQPTQSTQAATINFAAYVNPGVSQPGPSYGYATQPTPFYGDNSMGSAPSNDPFSTLISQRPNAYSNRTGPVPATYQKPERSDPFSDLNWK